MKGKKFSGVTTIVNRNRTQFSLDYDEVISQPLRPKAKPKAVPFLKWAGGKRKLVAMIISSAPISFKRYLEPFVGGGAVAFALGHQWMLLNDSNVELINTYQVVRDDLDILLPLLDEHQKQHSQAYFYMVRTQKPDTLSMVERAARFIYLNKTCFNGLYRVNKYGQFNVPFGKYVHPLLYDRESMVAASSILQSAELYAKDYTVFLKDHAQPEDFIYLDPPYVPIGQFSDFKRYTKEQFREDNQYRLAELYNDLVDLGAYPVLSNSYSELTLSLYAQHDIQIVYANRNINHDGAGRDRVPEILVRPRR